MSVTQEFKGSFIGSVYKSDFVNQIRTVKFMTFLRYARDAGAADTYECLKPICNSPNEELENRKAQVVDTLINVFTSDPDAKIPNICNCENLIEAVCCNQSYADVASYYNAQTDTDSFFV